MYSIMYNQIVNPATGRKVNVHGKIGKQVLQQYKEQLGGELFGKTFFRNDSHTDIAQVLGVKASELKNIPYSERNKLTIENLKKLTEEQLKHIATSELPDYPEDIELTEEFREERIRLLTKIKIPESKIKNVFIGWGQEGGVDANIKEFIQKICNRVQQPTIKRRIFQIDRPSYAFFKKKNKPYINEHCYHNEIDSDSDDFFWENYEIVYNSSWIPARMGLTPGQSYASDIENAMRDPFMLGKDRPPILTRDYRSRKEKTREKYLNEDNLKIDQNRLKNYILNNYTIVLLKKVISDQVKGTDKGTGVWGINCRKNADTKITKQIDHSVRKTGRTLGRTLRLIKSNIGTSVMEDEPAIEPAIERLWSLWRERTSPDVPDIIRSDVKRILEKTNNNAEKTLEWMNTIGNLMTQKEELGVPSIDANSITTILIHPNVNGFGEKAAQLMGIIGNLMTQKEELGVPGIDANHITIILNKILSNPDVVDINQSMVSALKRLAEQKSPSVKNIWDKATAIGGGNRINTSTKNKKKASKKKKSVQKANA